MEVASDWRIEMDVSREPGPDAHPPLRRIAARTRIAMAMGAVCAFNIAKLA